MNWLKLTSDTKSSPSLSGYFDVMGRSEKLKKEGLIDLGSGAFGQVWKKQLNNGSFVAIKYLNEMNENNGIKDETKDKMNTSQHIYQFLDEQTLSKVTYNDVKISLLKEHIEKAKVKQM